MSFTRHISLVAIIFSSIIAGCEYQENTIDIINCDDASTDTQPDTFTSDAGQMVDAGSIDTFVAPQPDAGSFDTVDSGTSSDAQNDTYVAMEICTDVAVVNNCLVVDQTGHAFYQTMFNWTCARCTRLNNTAANGCLWSENQNTLCVTDCNFCPHMRSAE